MKMQASMLMSLAVAANLALAMPQAPDANADPMSLPIWQSELIYTHNSYAKKDPGILIPGTAGPAYEKGLDGQMDLGVRVLEIDIFTSTDDHKDGEITHSGTTDTHCGHISECLKQIHAWSTANPDHSPIVVFWEIQNESLAEIGDLKPKKEHMHNAIKGLANQLDIIRGDGMKTISYADAGKPMNELRATAHGLDRHGSPMVAVSLMAQNSQAFESRTHNMDEDSQCNVVVRSTFLDVDDGQGLMTCFRRMRKAKTDFILLGEPEVYEPGKYSEADESCSAVQDSPNALHPTPDATQHVSLPPSSPGPSSCPPSPSQDLEERLQGDQTTVMLRNLPNNYTRDMLLTLLEQKGFSGRFDFIYLPMDFCRDANLGYAFVNLCDNAALTQLWRRFDGFCDWSLPSSKVCEVKMSGPHQGFKAHVERYRNSPVMHRSVPDEYKPVIFKDGVRVPFPRPTKRIKPPHGAFW